MSKVLQAWGWIFFVGLMASSFSAASPEGGNAGLEKILERYRVLLVEQESPDGETIRERVETLGGDGRWADLDYDDQSRGNWHPYRHLERVREMALGWADPGHDLHRDSAVEAAIMDALDHWVDRRYEAVNWWFNEIGAPRLVRDSVVLMGKTVAGDRRNGLLEIINQHKVRGTGANLVWTAELALHYGCLTGDDELVEESVNRIQNEITVGAPEGIQEDWSFFQHGARLQTFHYGRAYLEVVAAVGWQLRETEWAVPDEKVVVLSNFILKGMQWMLRGRDTVPGTMDRMASRPGTLQVDLTPLLRFWRDVDPERKEAIDTFIARQEGSVEPLSGFRHFPKADFTAYHRPEFSFFLKTVSDRTHLTESINEENLLGGDLNTGDHYLLTDESSYHNLPPVWDWDRLPGVVRAGEFLEINRKPFVGGLGDGRGGLAVMDMQRETDGRSLAVRRFWAFHEDWVLGLVGGWKKTENQFPYTCLDQRRWRGKVVAGFEDGESRVIEEGGHDLEGVRYLWHDGVAYLLLQPEAVHLRLGEASGSWYRINRNRSEERVSEKLFLAVLEHGSEPRPGGFVIAPAETPDPVRAWVREEDWSVLRNDEKVQAVLFGDNTGMAAFYEPGSLQQDRLGRLTVDRPCLAFWNEGQLRLADPTHEGGAVQVSWRGSEYTITLPPGGNGVAVKER